MKEEEEEEAKSVVLQKMLQYPQSGPGGLPQQNNQGGKNLNKMVANCCVTS